jgi:hypothetical protein
LGIAPLAFGQPSPDPNLWGPPTIVNPSGLRPVPAVFYDPSTGILSLDNRGLDGVSNTVGGMMIGGDDVGTISLLVEGPEPIASIPPFVNGCYDLCLILWVYQYFNGKAQLIGSGTPSNQFIRPAVNDIFQYVPGTAPQFGEVEMGINFAFGQPGAILFGRVQIVPEPASWIAGILGLCFFALLRSRGSSGPRNEIAERVTSVRQAAVNRSGRQRDL